MAKENARKCTYRKNCYDFETFLNVSNILFANKKIFVSASKYKYDANALI